MKRLPLCIAILIAASLVAGCVAPQHLNETSRSALATDTANLAAQRLIPYETKRIGNIDVSYNLFYGKSDNFSGYRLTLIFRNQGTTEETITPTLSLRDTNGFAILPYDYNAYVSEAAVLAGTVVPSIPATQQTNYYSTGTIRNTTTGTTYNYSGTTRSASSGGFAAGFAQGMAQGAAIRAANDREEGLLMMRWANTFWLRSSYTLPPGAAASGSLFMPAPQLGALPLRLRVNLGTASIEFLTAEK